MTGKPGSTMPGLPLIQPETATGETASLLAITHMTLGLVPNMTKAMANSPAALRGYLDFLTALGSGILPEAVRERIALLVAQENACDYGLSAHSYTGTKLAGLTEAEATRARKGEASDPQAAAALTVAAALVRNRGTLTDDELATAGGALSGEQIAEVIAHVALNIFTNYLTKAARVEIDWPLVRHTD
jgi:AhpD family alkylhydroperoxidase